jgi:hypothetical protein
LIDFVKFFKEYIRARKRQAGLVVSETDVRLVIINTKLKGVSRLEGPLSPTVLAKQSSVGVVGLITLKSPYGVVELSDNGLVKGFLEKLQLDYLINAGIYYIKPEIFQYLPEKGNLEKTTQLTALMLEHL